MAASDPFWQAAADGRLRLQWSTATDLPVQYPRDRSPYITDDELVWRDVEPVGTVLASTIVHRHSNPDFDAQTPFGLALVELAGGARLMTRFETTDEVNLGTSVAIEFRGSPPLPYVQPVER